VATSAGGTVAGEDRSFRTAASKPDAETGWISDLTSASATLDGVVDPHGASTQYFFEYGETEAFGRTTPLASAGAGTEPVTVQAALSGLRPRTTYHFRLVATNESGTGFGDDHPFATPGAGPSASTREVDPEAVSATGAGVAAWVNPSGATTSVTFEYGSTTAYGGVKKTPDLAANAGPTQVTTSLTGLAPATTYHLRVAATNAAGTNYGRDVTFTTRHRPPTATTKPAGSLATTQATLNGTANAQGLPGTAWFEFGTTTDYGSMTPEQPLAPWTTTTTVSAQAAPLLPGTTYHARLVVETDEGRVRGADVTFVTPR
jgi:phosphodiesterase/alkaline phosphatase D-like protein